MREAQDSVAPSCVDVCWPTDSAGTCDEPTNRCKMYTIKLTHGNCPSSLQASSLLAS